MCRLSPSVRALVATVLFTSTGAVWAAPADDPFTAAAQNYASRQWRAAADGFLSVADSTPDKERAATARFYAGEALVQLGRFDEAQRRLKEFLDEAPTHKFAKTGLFRLGECLLLAGKGAEAAARLEAFRAAHPQDELNAYALVYLGDLSLNTGKVDDARSRYEQSLREFPAGPLATQARFGVARCHQLAGQPDEAIATYQSIAAADGDALADDARLQVGVIQYGRGEHQATEATLAPFESSLSGSELRSQALHWMGLAQLADHRPQQAVKTLRSAIAAAGEKHDLSGIHFALADALRQANDLPAADEQFRLVLDRWPASERADDALHGRLIIAEAQGDAQRAESLASELVRRFEKSPHRPYAMLVQARLLLDRQQYAAAEPILSELVSTGGENLDPTRYFLGLSKLGQQKYEAALNAVAPARPEEPALAAAIGELRTAALFALARYAEAAPLLAEQLAVATNVELANRIRTQLVIALAQTGKLDEAAAELDRLPPEALAGEGLAAAALDVAERAYRADDLALAKKWFGALSVESVPAAIRGQALSGLAWTQLRTEGKEASAATFERVLRDYPDSPLAAEAALVRGRSLDEAAQYDAALTAYRLVIERYAQSPQMPAALLAAGRLHGKLDQDREAAELLERLVKDHPQFAEFDAALYVLAWSLNDLDRIDESNATFLRLSDEFPTSQFWAEATYHLAQQAARRKDHDETMRLAGRLIPGPCEAAIRQQAIFLCGHTAAAQARWDEAARFMNQFVLEYPTAALRPTAEYWLAEADYRRNHFGAAREKFDKLAEQHADCDSTWMGIVPLRVAQCLAQEKRWAEALAAAQAIADREPAPGQRLEVDYLIGRCLSSQGRLDDARAAYQKVVDSPAAAGSETAATARWMIGETLFHQKRYSEALAAYERCGECKSFPRWQAAGLLQAGKCRLLLGQKDKAIANFQQLTTELADTPYAGEARQRLAALGAPASVALPANLAQPPSETRTE